MPLIAHDPDSEDIVLVQQAGGDTDYRCPDCGADASFVRSHLRQSVGGQESRVRPHFRYPNCECYGVTPSENDGSGGGGGGGGGEDDLHKRRKREALAAALERYDDADHDLERDIGDKRADAVLVFETPHDEFGKGFAIEYQHKNESKDKAATEQEYARNEFTTLWLWEDQFDFSSDVPEIDLFDGRVYTPWPDAVPPTGRWRGSGLLDELQETWQQAKANDLVTYGAPATLPPEWRDDAALDIWRSQDWKDIVQRKSTGTHPLSEREVWHAEEYIRSATTDAESCVPATLRREWWRPLRAKRKETTSGDSSGLLTACPYCDAEETHQPIHPGEIRRGSRCGTCNGWYSIDTSTQQRAPLSDVWDD